MLRIHSIVVLLCTSAILNAQHGIVAAASGGPSTIGVVDTATNTSTLALPVTGQFASFAVTLSGTSAYFINDSPSQVVLIDLSTGHIDATIFIPSRGISAIALSPDGSRLFMAGTGGATFPLQVFIVDTSSNTVTKSTSLPDIQVPMLGYQIAVSADGGMLFVPSTSNPANVYVISTSTLQVETTIALTFSSSSLAVAPNALFVGGTSGTQGFVAYIDVPGFSLHNLFSLIGSKCSGQLVVDGSETFYMPVEPIVAPLAKSSTLSIHPAASCSLKLRQLPRCSLFHRMAIRSMRGNPVESRSSTLPSFNESATLLNPVRSRPSASPPTGQA